MSVSRFFSIILLFSCFFMANSSDVHAKVTLKKSADGYQVLVDGELFTEYLIKSGNKPILWPLVGPGGKRLTREYPVVKKKVADERQDHVHHRGMWFTHGNVNGISFWHEGKNTGTIKHTGFKKINQNHPNMLITTNDWIGPDGKKICQDIRVMKFKADNKSRIIDFSVTVTATDGPVTFGDTKEGSFGIRVAGSMKVDAKKGGKIANSNGDKNKSAWGKRANWVDFNGPVDGKTMGIAILNHPESHASPTYWHARTYGLFAANPFGAKKFSGGKKKSGAVTLKKGEKISLIYRVILHTGDEKEAKIAEAYADYLTENSKK